MGDFTGRAAYAQALLQKLSNVLNSGQFITNDVGFSASVLFSRPETKEGKRVGGGPGQKICDHLVKESRCVCEIKNKDKLCCARAIVVMREYAKRTKAEQNNFENIRNDRGKNSQQLKEAKRLHEEAGVVEGPCGLEEIEKFQDYLGPQGYRIIVVDARKGGVILKGEAFLEAKKKIEVVKSVYEDDRGDLKAHYDELYSIPGFMNRSYFCYLCCKGSIQKIVLIITVKRRIALAVKETRPIKRRGVKILRYGRNQIEVVSFADVSFMEKPVFKIT